MTKEKKAMELPFNWIFVIITGGAILLLALYGVNKFVVTSEKISYSETGAKFIAIFESLGGIGSEKIDINLKESAEIEINCDELTNRPFGIQTISFEKEENKGEEIEIKDKYLFSKKYINGKNFYVFSKPFYFGYRVGDLIIMSSEDYCFFKTPEKVKEEIKNLGIENIKFENEKLGNCKGVKVCFEDIGCDIKIISEDDFSSGRVIKNGKENYFVGSLIFGAIFSSTEIYECNVKRIKKRFDELALIYKEKIKILNEKECENDIGEKLEGIRKIEINSSKDLILLKEIVEEIKNLNNIQQKGCKVW